MNSRDLDFGNNRALFRVLKRCGNNPVDTPLCISSKVPNYRNIANESDLYSARSEGRKVSGGCLSFLQRFRHAKQKDRVAPEKNTLSNEVAAGCKLVQKLGYHATPNAQSLLSHGLVNDFNSAAHLTNMQFSGEGVYIAETVGGARVYLPPKGEIVEVWAVLDKAQLDPYEMQRDNKGDLVIREDGYKRVFFKKLADEV
jgi:hypothetical protein